MAIGSEDGSASRNATLDTAGAIWPLPRGAARRGLPSAEHQGVRALPAVQRRRDHLGAGKLFGGHQPGPWTGFAVLCGYAVVLTGLAAWRLRRLSTLKAARIQVCPSRHRVMSDGKQWADVDRGSGYKSEHDRIEPEMRRSYAGEMVPELAVLRHPAARASRSIGNA
jgi:hypothetical protein